MASDPHGRGFADLTARARIRDAAIRLFTEHGVEGTSILAIATAAGVSGGLIRHHFGSKDGLRAACDAYVLDELIRFKGDTLDQLRSEPAAVPTFDARQVLLRRYFGRAMIDGSPAAAARFAEIVEMTERWFVEHSALDLPDPRATAAVLTAMQTGLMVMQDHIARALGADPDSPQALQRMMLAAGSIYSPALVSPEELDRARRSLRRPPGAAATPPTQSAEDTR